MEPQEDLEGVTEQIYRTWNPGLARTEKRMTTFE